VCTPSSRRAITKKRRSSRHIKNRNTSGDTGEQAIASRQAEVDAPNRKAAMKHLLRATALAVTSGLLLVGLVAGPATAASSNTTSITLTCDKNVDASASLTLQPSQADTTSLGQVEISCGPNSNVARQRNRVDVPTGALAAGWVTITAWTNSTDTGPNNCLISGPLPYKNTCTNAAGIGSQLVVR
jgi:hypothetical protein